MRDGLLPATPLHRVANRTADRRAAVHPSLGATPHRLPPAPGPIHRRSGSAPSRMPRVTDLGQATGLAVRRPPAHRYEHDTPGDLMHVDIKKLGRIPDGGGHRKFGRIIGNRHNKRKGLGYAFQPPRGRRPIPVGVLGGTPRRTQGDRRRVSGTGPSVLRSPRYRGASGVDRQRILLPLFLLRCGARSERQAPLHPPQSTADQWEGRTIQSHPDRRVGVRLDVSVRRGPLGDLPVLAPSLQSPPTPHRNRRQVTYRPRRRSQRPQALQLAGIVAKGAPLAD